MAIPHVVFSPYGPSWLTLKRRVGDPEYFKVVPGSLPVTSKGGAFLDQMAGVKLLDLSLDWTVTWYVTCSSQKPVSSFTPGNQYLKQLPHGGPYQIWPRPKKLRVRPPAEDSGDCDGDDEDVEEALALEDAGDPDDHDDVDDGNGSQDDENLLGGDEYDDEEVEGGGGMAPTASLAMLTLDNGCTISVYRDGRFEAVCRHCDHLPSGRCRLTRTRVGSDDPNFQSQGRPLGLMAAWCLSQGDYDCRERHCDAFAVYSQSLEARTRARAHLMSLPGALDLFRYERDQRLGEVAEPIEWA